MNKYLTNKNRFYMLLFGALLLIWLSFKFGFSRSFEIKEQLEIRKDQFSTIQDAPQKLKLINDKLGRIDKLINDVSGEETSSILIEKIGRFCKENNVVLIEIPGSVQYQNDEFSVTTHKVVVQGSFKKLAILLNQFEQNSSVGKLRAVSYHSEFNLRKARKELFGTFYLQTIGKEKKND